MFRTTAIALFILLFCFKTTSYAQNSIGLNFNKNYFSYPKKSKKYLLGNTGIGLSFLKKDTIKRFINYELTIGIDFNNVTIIDQYNRPPVFDYNKRYTHSINNLNINSSLSLKKYVYRGSKYKCYIGAGASPKWFFLSKAKVTYNDSLYYSGEGVRLIQGEFIKIYDLFYTGIELYKKCDIRIQLEGTILQECGDIDFYYLQAENSVGFSQLSFQIIFNI